MLYTLGDPLSFVLLGAAFVLSVTLHGLVRAALLRSVGLSPARAAARGSRFGRFRAPARLRDVSRGPRDPRHPVDPRRFLDPFGTIAAALGGIGWGRPLEGVGTRRRGPLLLVTLVPGLLDVAIGLGLLAAFGARTGLALGAGSDAVLQHGAGGALAPRVLLLAGVVSLFCGLLSLLPVAPMDGGWALFGLAPLSMGWQKARHYLVDQNLGVVGLLVLLLPLGGRSLVLTVCDAVAAPLVRLVTGG